MAGILYSLVCRDNESSRRSRNNNKSNISSNKTSCWDDRKTLSFAVALATLKVQREGFDGLDSAAAEAEADTMAQAIRRSS